MQPLKFPRHIDEPPYFLVWRADVFLAFLVVFSIGILINQKIIAIILGIAVAKFFRKFQEGKLKGYIFHVGYWFGFIKGEGYSMPNPYERQYIP